MATTFLKLGLKKKDEVKTIQINGQNVNVKQYLPISEKIKLIENVLQYSADDNNFANPIKVEVYFNLELVYRYTDISFTEKQKEDAPKLYDLLEENGVFPEVIAAIPELEYTLLYDWTKETIDAFYKYRNSALGIMEQISADYSQLDLDANEIKKKLSEPGNLNLLKEVLDKLG